MAKKIKKASAEKKYPMTRWAKFPSQERHVWQAELKKSSKAIDVWRKTNKLPAGTSWEMLFSRWVISSMILNAWKKIKNVPTEFRLRKECIEEQPDGSGLLHYEVRF